MAEHESTVPAAAAASDDYAVPASEVEPVWLGAIDDSGSSLTSGGEDDSTDGALHAPWSDAHDVSSTEKVHQTTPGRDIYARTSDSGHQARYPPPPPPTGDDDSSTLSGPSDLALSDADGAPLPSPAAWSPDESHGSPHSDRGGPSPLPLPPPVPDRPPRRVVWDSSSRGVGIDISSDASSGGEAEPTPEEKRRNELVAAILERQMALGDLAIRVKEVHDQNDALHEERKVLEVYLRNLMEKAASMRTAHPLG